MKEKAVKWVKNKWLIAFAIIGVLMFIARKPLVVFVGWLGGIDVDNAVSAGDLLRSFILLLGVIGGGYGLYLSVKRQKTFSDQVQVQVDQSFNDRLGRGVKLLANENTAICCAGVQILKDLVDNANDRQKSIIAKIIYDFFRDKTKIEYDETGYYNDRVKGKTTQDLQDAIDILINLPLNIRQKLRANGESQLDFQHLNFNHLSLRCKKLEQVDFSHSRFSGTNFFIDEIKNAKFDSAEFMLFKFTDIKFTNVEFINTEFVHGSFVNARFKGVKFTHTKLIEANLNNVSFEDTYFIQGNFQSDNTVKISSPSHLPRFIGVKIEQTKFDFSDNIDQNDFFELCYYHKNDWSFDDYNPIDSNREYANGAFVKSDEPWSEQPTLQWVNVEVTEWQLVRAKKNGEDTATLELRLPGVKEALRRAQERLKENQKKTKKTP